VLRRATADDVEEIVAIFEPSFATLDFLPELHTHEEHLAWFESRVREDEAYLLGGGFAILQGDWLTHLYVHPDAIGTGVGHALFEHVTTRRPDGFQFWVFQQNERARRFYEAHGAVAVEFTDGSGNEERTPDVRYEWRPPAR
jgi:GNAT superfamily N-acetyltransferase